MQDVRSELADHAFAALRRLRLAVTALEDIGEKGDPRSRAIAVDAIRAIHVDMRRDVDVD